MHAKLNSGSPPPNACRILSLDGGGAKGFYTLGVLREIEALLNKPLYKTFDLIFGTSTGSIIASLISLGHEVEEIHKLYRDHIPSIMKAKKPKAKSSALAAVSQKVFGSRKFDAVKTSLGVVATKWQTETPMIFKGSAVQVHGRAATFVPGFGCTIAVAVEASCSAYPFFKRKIVTTVDGDVVELVDGGYCANNPTLYAIADAVAALSIQPKQCRVLSLGVGNYPHPQPSLKMLFAKKYLLSVQLLQKTLEINTASMDQLRKILFAQVPTVRICETFDRPEMATDIFEHDLDKLNLLRQRGADSFAERENDVRKLLLSEEDG